MLIVFESSCQLNCSYVEVKLGETSGNLFVISFIKLKSKQIKFQKDLFLVSTFRGEMQSLSHQVMKAAPLLVMIITLV